MIVTTPDTRARIRRPHRSPNRRKTRHGFTLVEMGVVVALLGTFGLIMAELFRSSMDVLIHTYAAPNAAARWDAVIDEMRQDVWRGRRVIVSSAQRMEVLQPDEHRIVWQIVAETDEIHRRLFVGSDRTDEVRWTDVPRLPIFEPAAEGLIVRLEGDGPDGVARTTLVSQSRLMGGE